MTVEHSQNRYRISDSGAPTASELIERLKRFDGPPEQFLVNLLAVQCFLAQAEGGAVLRKSQARGVEVLAVYPQMENGATAPPWLAQSVEFVRKTTSINTTTIGTLHDADELYGQPARRHLLIVPLKMVGTEQAVASFLIETSDRSVIEAGRERLELTANLLSLYEMRLTLQRRQLDLKRLQMAMEILSAINRPSRFISVAMAFCNEVASQWQCERASLGFLKGRYVQLKAISHTEKFSRKMRVIQDIESAMEECLDQDIEIIYPPDAEAAYINRAANALSRQYGPLAILSLPLRRDGETLAVLTLQRQADKPFNPEEIETARLTCELCSARLISLYENDRWIGDKAACRIRSAASALVKPKYTWAKILAATIFVALVFVIFGKGNFRAHAPFVLEATYQQFVPAPFDGYIKSVSVLEGDMVEAGKTTLAKLDTAELMLQLAQAKAEKLGWDKEADAARGKLNTAQVQIAEANADKAKAQIDLLEYQISQANITSPISGIVVKGDWKRAIGAPVKTGDVLFEIAVLESLRAQLLVPEDQIADIGEGQQGYLATASFPGQRIKFVVERINPMAEVVSERNVFKVRVRLLTMHSWMRPGMEGVAKVSVGRRSYVWIWTHRFTSWVRMKFWL